MITKEQAIYNVTKAYLDYKLKGRLFWDDRSADADVRQQTQREYFRADTVFETLSRAYVECGLLGWADVDTVTKMYTVEKANAE
jgi:hypothetical protein